MEGRRRGSLSAFGEWVGLDKVVGLNRERTKEAVNMAADHLSTHLHAIDLTSSSSLHQSQTSSP